MKKRTTIIPALCVLMILICFAGAQTVGSSDTGVQMVILDKTSAAMYSGSSQRLQLNALALPETADFPGIRWSIRREPLCFAADDRVGTLSTYSMDDPGTKVNQTGMVTAGRASETAVVTVQTLDGELSASCTVRFYNAAQINERLNMLGYLNPEDGQKIPSIGETEPYAYSLSKFQVRMGLTETGEPDIPTLTALFGENALASNEPVTSVAITPSYVEILADGELYTDLIAEILPKDAADKSITWTSSDPDSLYIYNPSGWIRGYAPGTFTVTAESSNGVTATCTVKVKPVPVNSITLSRTNIKIAQGALFSTPVYATVNPETATNKNLVWTSSNPAVASVSPMLVGNILGANISGVGIGTATITATAADGSGITATCTVTVGKKITAISLPATGRVEETKQLRLTATITPSDAIIKTLNWSSSNESIATVNATGLVTGKKSGTAVITAQATDGSGISATCTVTVYYTPVTSVSMGYPSGDSYTKPKVVFVGETKAFPFTASVSPSNATYQTVTWCSSNSNMLSISGGNMTGKAEGKVQVWAEAGGKSCENYKTKHYIYIIDKTNCTSATIAAASHENHQKQLSYTSNVLRTRLVQVAASQLGYQNGTQDLNEGKVYFYKDGTGGWSKYGAFTPNNKNGEYNWCAAFVNWCARKSGISESTIVKSGDANMNINRGFIPATVEKFDPNTGYYTEYKVPTPGDLVYFGESTSSVKHIGIVKGYNAVTHQVSTIEGNTNNGKVAERSRYVDDGDYPVIGYSHVLPV